MAKATAALNRGPTYCSGGGAIPTNAESITRSAGARWWLPSSDEWHKSAYYDASALAYRSYPMGDDAIPNNNPPWADDGNSANFPGLNYTTGDPNYPLTSVGAYRLSPSPYGTFDQGGNVYEWIDTKIEDVRGACSTLRKAAANRESRGCRPGATDGRAD
jgi:formylglycine-generating enzyme required for sulfatase activity